MTMSMYRTSTRLSLIGIICLCVFTAWAPPLGHAARPDGLDEPAFPENPASERHKSGVGILKVQEALAEMGYYLGNIDGHLNEETKAAVRVYQKAMGQKVDGRITRQLWDLLNNAVQVRGLLKRLDTARKSGKDKAREALLAHSATQDLITDTSQERANPTRNAEACFAKPTVRCLLTEARESVKAVFKPELRDWALGEILVAQARAGLSEQAMKSAASIRDPRLIIVALRDIAEAQAAAGNATQALEAADIIPDDEKRAEALAKIAQIHARQANVIAARAAANTLLDLLENLEPVSKQINLKMQLALVFDQVSSPIRVNQMLTSSRLMANQVADEKDRKLSLRHIATALAKLGRTDEAMQLTELFKGKSEREPILVAIAKAMAHQGQTKHAISTSSNISSRYRASLLSDILLAQAQVQGDGTDSLTTTAALAGDAIKEIKLPYARSFAQSRLALTTAKVGELHSQSLRAGQQPDWTAFSKASEVAKEISDHRLRAYTLWSVAFYQQRAGDVHGAEATEALAELSTGEIKSRLSRVWMFADIAAQHARQGHSQSGWEAFNQGLKIGKSIDNAWSRSRSLAKLAQTLIELIAPGKGRDDITLEN